MVNIGIVIGTRPEIIKLAPLIRECEKRNVQYFIVHTGQHYSYELDALFFEELKLPKPKYALKIPSVGPHRQGQHTGNILIQMEEVLLKEMPSVLIVHGDTNSALGGALLASKITTTKAYTGYDIPIAHIEAGLRSFDRSMPEEINRVICDHLSQYLFAPTEGAKANALKEGIPAERVFVVGNTIVDAVLQHKEMKGKDMLKELKLEPKQYALVTLHRQENVDNKERLSNILQGLADLSKHTRVIYPIHPRTRAKIEEFGLTLPDSITVIDPIGFLEFLQLENNAAVILTDSGGVQEESCILGVGCVTLRDNTERPETIEVGSNVLAGSDPEKIVQSSLHMLKKKTDWKNPFGDGTTSKQILDILTRT